MAEEHEHRLSSKRFTGVTSLNLAITVIEIIGGIGSGSLALITDAVHNFGDSLSIVLSFVAQRIGGREQDEHATFGYHRVEILAAFINSLVLIAVSLGLIWAGCERLFAQHQINGSVMLWTAVIGFIFNTGSALLLHSDASDSLNIKATYLHLLADALSSIAVIIGAIVVMIFHIYWVDAVLTIVVAGYVIYETIAVVRQTAAILLQAAPALDYDKMVAAMKTVPGVVDVHHIHAWMEDEHDVIFSAHVNVAPENADQIEVITAAVAKKLQTEFAIAHVTLQLELTHGLHSARFAKHELS